MGRGRAGEPSVRHSRQMQSLWDWVYSPTNLGSERRRIMASNGAGKASGQKPTVRIEYCTS
jgi:hypothetical protein